VASSDVDTMVYSALSDGMEIIWRDFRSALQETQPRASAIFSPNCQSAVSIYPGHDLIIQDTKNQDTRRKSII
jgi:hypothetical protein